MIIKSVPDAPKMYVLQGNKSDCAFCSFSSAFYFIGDKIDADCFKDEITPLIKANYRLKFAQNVALNNWREKGKPWCKLSYKGFKEKYVYVPLLDISTYPILITLRDFLDGIHHCVIVVVKWVFDGIVFAIPLTKDNLDYCCINDNETKGINCYKGVFKSIRFFTKENNKSVIQKWKLITCVW